MNKLTKIVATVSDRSASIEFLNSLFDAGVNAVRLNTAHQEIEDAKRVIDMVREISTTIPIMVDTKGPEVRTTASKSDTVLTTGDVVTFTSDENTESTPTNINVSYEGFVNEVVVGDIILIDDGDISLSVTGKEGTVLTCVVNNTGKFSGRKSVNVPGKSLNVPSLSEKDVRFINFAAEYGVEFIAHSFVRNKEDAKGVQAIIDKYNSKTKIIAKIENKEGVDKIEEILDHVYGVMVARGDLGIEMPAEAIPAIQKNLVKKCREARKPVIIATQMLHTMIENPRPTRAEVSDIAHAVYQGADAIMLSGETAYGDYPIEAVKTMAAVAKAVEEDREQFQDVAPRILSNEITAYLTRTAVEAGAKIEAKAIVADSASGRTVRSIASYRSKRPVFAICYDKQIVKELGLSYGVTAKYMEKRNSTDEFLNSALSSLIEDEKITADDVVIVVAGNYGEGTGASFIEICEAGKILKHQK